MPFGRRVRPLWRSIVALLLGCAALVGVATPVSAHTDFESSSPADGETLDAPVAEIVLTFTTAATPAGDEFQVLDGDGTLREPTSVAIEEDRIFRLSFEPPLAGGQIGVRWSVRAGDAHPISGAFSFTVTAPSPTVAPPTTLPATTVPPVETTEVEAGSGEAGTGVTTIAADTEIGSDGDTGSEIDVAAGSGTDVTGGADSAGVDDSSTQVATTSLDEFLAADAAPEGSGTARIGRLIGFAGVVFGLGALAFASAVLVGSRREVGITLQAVRVLGAAVAIGAAIEYVGVASLLDETIGGAWSTSAGFATVLRLVGGLALVVGIRATIVRVGRPAPLSADVTVPGSDADVVTPGVSARAGGVAGADGAADLDDPVAAVAGRRTRWRPDASSSLAAVGVVAVLASFWFDGHTVTKGFRPLHALANTVHVAAGAVWVGGVAAMALIAWLRFRAGEPRRFGELVVRFSSIATIALVAVALAGSLMTFMIMDSFSELTGTPWGELLLLKLTAVAVAVAIGAYNHFKLRPALDADPDDPSLLVMVRNTLTAETIVLAFVVVVTVWLVVAAS